MDVLVGSNVADNRDRGFVSMLKIQKNDAVKNCCEKKYTKMYKINIKKMLNKADCSSDLKRLITLFTVELLQLVIFSITNSP